MIKKYFITAVFVMLFNVNSFAADKYHWKLTGTENNCQLYTSAVPGKDYIAAQASCILPTRIEIVAEILRDITSYPEWMEGCKETKILKVYDPKNDGFIFWYHQSIPIETDRDMVLKSMVNLDSKNGKVTICSELTKEIPYDAGKGYIRMLAFSSVWTLERVDKEHTMVTFMIDPDLGKGLPIFLANPMIKTMPYKSLLKMMKIMKNVKYIEAGKTSRYLKFSEGTPNN